MKAACGGEKVTYHPHRRYTARDRGVGFIVTVSRSGKTAKVQWPTETTYCKLQSLRREN